MTSFKLGNEVDHELAVRAQRLAQRVAPAASSASLLPSSWRTRLWKAWASVAYGMSRLYWSNLPDGEQAARRDEHLVQLVDDRGLADAGIAGHEHELRRAARHDPVEGGEQRVDLALAPVELLRDQQPVRHVVRAERERRRCRRCASHSARQRRRSASTPGRGLVAVLGGLGEQLHDDRRERRRGRPRTRSPGGTGCRAMWQCTHSIGSEAVKGSVAGQHLVEGDAERIEIAAGIDRAVHAAGLFRRHVGERAGDAPPAARGPGARAADARRCRSRSARPARSPRRRAHWPA